MGHERSVLVDGVSAVHKDWQGLGMPFCLSVRRGHGVQGATLEAETRRWTLWPPEL